MDASPDVLIFYAYRCSKEMGEAAEAVLKGKPTLEQCERLYDLLERSGGKLLSEDVFLALLEAIKRASADH